MCVATNKYNNNLYHENYIYKLNLKKLTKICLLVSNSYNAKYVSELNNAALF